MNKENGFTLIELMIVLVIVATVAAIALPSFRDTTMSNKLSSSASGVHNMFRYARSEASRSGRTVTVGALKTGLTGDSSGSDKGDWVNGAIVYLNEDGAAKPEFLSTADTELRRFAVTGDGFDVVISSNSGRVEFLGSGFISAQTTIKYCDDRTGESGRLITLLLSGMSSISSEDC